MALTAIGSPVSTVFVASGESFALSPNRSSTGCTAPPTFTNFTMRSPVFESTTVEAEIGCRGLKLPLPC